MEVTSFRTEERIVETVLRERVSWSVHFYDPLGFPLIDLYIRPNKPILKYYDFPYTKYFFPLMLEETRGEHLEFSKSYNLFNIDELNDLEKIIDKHGEKLIALFTAEDRMKSMEGLSEWSKVDPEIGEKILKTAHSLKNMMDETYNIYDEKRKISNELEKYEKERNMLVEYNLSKRLIEH